MSDKELSLDQAALVEKVVVGGDLSVLQPRERLLYYKQVCESVGLNPLTKPLEYIKLNNKLVLYAKRDATDQLRKIHGVSIKIVCREKVDDLYIVTAQATDKSGRCDESTGAVNLAGLKGEAAANAIMKAETKAKRRVTLSIAGLGLLDETEVSTIPGAVEVPLETFTPITAAQVTELTVLLNDAQADWGKFCAYFKIDSVESLPAQAYEQAVALLKAKKAQTEKETKPNETP